VTRVRAEAALIGNTLIWGVTFVVVKDALSQISTLLFLTLRFSVAAVVLLVLFRRAWSNVRSVPSALRGGAITGCFLFLGYYLQTLGLRYTSAPKSAFLTGLASVMVPLLVLCVYRNRPRMGEMAGILAATAGMALMTVEGPLRGINRGDVLTFGCAVAFAAHMVALGHFSNAVNPNAVSFELMSMVQIGTAALLALLLFGWTEAPVFVYSARVVVAVLITGILATALAFTVMAWAQRYTTSTRTALIYLLEPVFAWMTSFLLMGEGLSARAAAGAMLILGGVVLVEVKPFAAR